MTARALGVEDPSSTKAAPVRLSVVVPAWNAARDLVECLGALRADLDPDMELIVVDDASTDDTAGVAAKFATRVFRLPRRSGPAAARNHGARHASGDILVFVDADVVVHPGALQQVLRTLTAHPDVAAIFGSFDTEPRAAGLVSQYRNLLHCFFHQRGRVEASTFWAGCGAIRRAVFEAAGGFDAARYPRPTIEDVELGFRLRRAGHRIRLEKTLQGSHLKQWTLTSVIRTDIRARAIPWARLLLEGTAIPDDLNLARRQRVSAAVVVGAVLTLPLALLRPAWLAVPAAGLGAAVALNWDLFAFFYRLRGLAFATACVPLHLLYFLYCAGSYAYVWLDWHLTGASPRVPAQPAPWAPRGVGHDD